LSNSGFEASIDGEKDIYNRIDNDFLIQEVFKLPTIYSSILQMRYIDDFSVSHISKLIGNTENNVSVKIHRGLIKLREVVIKRYGALL
jgi:DNA-directed RNA polymerase specialized sigma24 family protein